MTVEANPETVDPRVLDGLRAAGFTRISLGMQSAVPHVLAALDRVHQPGRPEQCAAWARAAGFEHVSLDLIYGTPGETAADWERSLTSALAAGPDHISAYALIVEEGTRLAARIRRGELAAPTTTSWPTGTWPPTSCSARPGLTWYEISNWAAAGRPGAVTTSCTGPGPTGGASGRARTATSAAPAGGTSGTRPPTPSGSRRGIARPRPGRS